MKKAALTDLLTEHAREKYSDIHLVTKWVAVVECMDENGDKYVTGFRGPTSDACPVWDFKGLLNYAATELTLQDEEESDE